ncbi:MAG: 3-deoxy-7-phosphoheptulonate synthase [Gemmatimonadetes bacterium]|nr:3-deoxy-7-phosphoheptulonate synthase [Gemmatimonadota bacterium]NIQ52570.1 3-deoxy-7-phosphoheptulonate synthase [Gemmatimonadota bacterium]NIU72708.1 3-deoxy-7-phosphoheptulonate synthase [Gammaproteobacteria bacterium]NIX43114.1 3-deoxy-7-phosphoheptulonate synthase [Gemmatimonadota bacterium]NIY07276.1 3-deoxy-7-phosphoheptulonate synthase [Gemmatimonadota bacterium]
MIVTLTAEAEPAAVRRALAGRGLWVRRLEAGGRVQFYVEPGSARVDAESLRGIAGVAAVAEEPTRHPRVDAQPGVVEVGGVSVGSGAPVLMAGPCSVESEAQIHEVAGHLAALGVTFLRGGAFKTRTSPYSFQGHGEPALTWLREAADASGLNVVTEVLSPERVPLLAPMTDLIQIGSRNMQNSALLEAAAAEEKPILLKRGMAATIEEWLLAGEHCLVHGAPAVVFCERGIRSFDSSTRNLLDLGAVALLARVHGLPVIVDPSHATGRRDLLLPLSRAAVAAGAAGVMVETHPDPGSALSDGSQALPLEAFAELARAVLAEGSP